MVPGNTLGLLGRRARQYLTGPPSPGSRAAGNDLPAISYDVRGDPDGYPTSPPGGGEFPGSSSFGGTRLPPGQGPGPWYNPGGATGAYGGGWADGTLTVRDRHVMTRYGHTTSGTEESTDVGRPNPNHDGPPAPQYQMLDTTVSYQAGTDGTANLDNPGPHNTVEVTGQAWRRYPLGQQDGNQTPVFGPPLGEYREYGVRGPSGMHGPAPDILDPNTLGKATLVQAGEPGTQANDRRLVYGGVPHGLHSPTIQSTVLTMSRQANITQMTAPRVDRPASSKNAGQSMSQTFQPQAEAGESPKRAPRMSTPGRVAGVSNRFLPR